MRNYFQRFKSERHENKDTYSISYWFNLFYSLCASLLTGICIACWFCAFSHIPHDKSSHTRVYVPSWNLFPEKKTERHENEDTHLKLSIDSFFCVQVYRQRSAFPVGFEFFHRPDIKNGAIDHVFVEADIFLLEIIRTPPKWRHTLKTSHWFLWFDLLRASLLTGICVPCWFWVFSHQIYE